jgi:hypothetical protein
MIYFVCSFLNRILFCRVVRKSFNHARLTIIVSLKKLFLVLQVFSLAI